MEKSEIRFFPDPILRQKTRDVTSFDHSLALLVRKMEKIMRAQKHGIGIAAPQIGDSRSVALVDVSSRVEGASLLVLVNPRILQNGREVLSREGCMSLPDYTADLKRYDGVSVRWQSADGLEHERKFQGIEAICVQHEVDHLNGVLFLDRVACLKTDMHSRTMNKHSRR